MNVEEVGVRATELEDVGLDVIFSEWRRGNDGRERRKWPPSLMLALIVDGWRGWCAVREGESSSPSESRSLSA